MLCNEHLESFNCYSDKWRVNRIKDKTTHQYKIDYNVEIAKIITIIRTYIENNFSLKDRKIYLL